MPELLQPQHSINTSTNPEGCHMSNFIRQNEVHMANEPLKFEKPLLESSSEMDKSVYNQHLTFPRHQNYRDADKISCSRILGDGYFQLTENWSAKILVEESQKCNTLFPRSSGKKFLKNLYRKFLNICKDPCRSAVVLT